MAKIFVPSPSLLVVGPATFEVFISHVLESLIPPFFWQLNAGRVRGGERREEEILICFFFFLLCGVVARERGGGFGGEEVVWWWWEIEIHT